MIISQKLKYVFLEVPKTGTRSIDKILIKYFYGKETKGHGYILNKRYKNYFKFMVIRNPYSRIVSTWWSTTQRGKDRYNWIKEAKGKSDLETILKLFINSKIKHKINHAEKQKCYYDAGVNKILRFEYLEKDFNTLPFIKEYIKLPKLNKTYNKRKSYCYYMNDKIIKIINDYYKEDFKIGNYKIYKNKKEMMKDIQNESI